MLVSQNVSFSLLVTCDDIIKNILFKMKLLSLLYYYYIIIIIIIKKWQQLSVAAPYNIQNILYWVVAISALALTDVW